jgi:DNA mismatch repair protein MutL
MIDQHAAHERLLYDRFLSGPVPRQELLAPIPFSTESEGDDRFLAAHREEFAGMGVLITGSEGSWQIEALPAGWRLPDVDTVRAILDLRTAGGNFARRWAASMACHSAVRDGSYLDETTALALGEAALALPEPRCPHGRPVWWELSREDLFRAVRRIEPSGPPLP